MKNIWDTVCQYGYLVMTLGFAVVAAGGITLIRSQQTMSPYRQYAWPVIVVGLVIYALGRVAVAMKKSASRKSTKEESTDEL